MSERSSWLLSERLNYTGDFKHHQEIISPVNSNCRNTSSTSVPSGYGWQHCTSVTEILRSKWNAWVQKFTKTRTGRILLGQQMEQNFGEFGLRMLWCLLQVRMPCNILCLDAQCTSMHLWSHGACQGHAFGYIFFFISKFGHDLEWANSGSGRWDLSFQKSEAVGGASFSPCNLPSATPEWLLAWKYTTWTVISG